MNAMSYHAQRARDEWQRSLVARGAEAAEAHRELALMHLRKLMACDDEIARQQAEQILTTMSRAPDPREEAEPTPPPPVKPSRGKLGLRFA